MNALLNAKGIKINQASGKGNLDVVNVLLKTEGVEVNQAQDGVDVNSASKDYGRTPLWIACGKGDENTVTALVNAKGIDINQPDIYQSTRLSVVMHVGHIDIVLRLLTQQGIDTTISNENGDTPLSIA